MIDRPRLLDIKYVFDALLDLAALLYNAAPLLKGSGAHLLQSPKATTGLGRSDPSCCLLLDEWWRR